MALDTRISLGNVTQIGFSNPGGLLAAGAIVFKTGTVTVGVGSASVVGTGTLFNSELTVGDILLINGQTRQVSVITNDTHLTLLSVHPTGATGVKYSVMPLIFIHLVANSETQVQGVLHGLTGVASGTASYASGSFDLYNSSNAFVTSIVPGTPAGDIDLTAPITNGTLALTSDITGGTLAGSFNSLTITGNLSAAAWTTSGLRLKGITGTLTDTSSSGTVAAAYTNKLGGNTIAATNATTFTNYISLYASEPVQGTNVTLTNKWALGADSLYIGTSNPFKVTSAGAVSGTTLALGGATIGSDALSLTGSAAFTTSVRSTTALATPSALSATQWTGFASTVSGAAIMGFGTTNDVALMNRAGTVCLGVGPNTTTVNIPALLTIGGLTFPNNTWMTSTDTKQRLYCGTNDTTYLKGGATVETVILRDSNDANMAAFSAASSSFGGISGAAAATRRVYHKVSSIADATATRVLRITIPNGAHSGVVNVTLAGSLGTGGAIGANEATESLSYSIGITRFTGVAGVAVISAAFGDSGSVAVAGATTIAVTAALTNNAEGVGVSNTVDLKVTITKGGGSSANHTCMVLAECINANATGITIAP